MKVDILVAEIGSTTTLISAFNNVEEDIILVANKSNMGFPKGCNQGIEVATGNEILLLNKIPKSKNL